MDMKQEEEEEKLQPQQAPVISAVCIDVRELLQRAAATDSTGAAYAHSGPYHYSNASSTTATPRLPTIKQRSARTAASTSAFWAPGIPPTGGYSAHSGPPPLSPADPTVLHAILESPPPTIRAAASPQNTAPSRVSASWSTRRSQSSKQTPSPTRTNAAHSSVRGGDVPSAAAGTAASPHSRGSAAASPGENQASAVRSQAPSYVASTNISAAGAATELNEADLSPAAQQTLFSVMSRMHEHAALILRDAGEAGEGTGAADRGGGPSAAAPHARGGYGHSSIGVRSRKGAPLPSRGGDKQMHELPQPSPVTTTLYDASTRPLKCPPHLQQSGKGGKHGDDWDGGVLPSKTEARHQQGARAAASAATAAEMDGAHDRSRLPPSRTVPPAFRRHLQYAEAAPTTRRPKRK